MLRLLSYCQPRRIGGGGIRLFADRTTPTDPNDPNTPKDVRGNVLDSWEKYHNQFMYRPVRPGIDSDERDIGLYPRVPPFRNQLRDPRDPWDDKDNLRNFGEPVQVEAERLGTWAMDVPDRGMGFMLAGFGGFVGGLGLLMWALKDLPSRQTAVPRDLIYNKPGTSVKV